MRGLVSVAVVALIGCASGPKPPAAIRGGAVPKALTACDASPADASPADASLTDASFEASRADASRVESSPPESAPPESSRSEASGSESRTPPTAAETRECAARGGTIQAICMLGELACVVHYRDGGKRCRDKRDCTGQCLYEGPTPPPAQAAGSCQRTSDPCGCKAPIHKGRVEAALCVD